MIDTFDSYLEKGRAKRKTADPEEARSLLMKAEQRIKYLRPLSDETAALVLEDAYEALREAAQSLMSIKGFKPYSHEATISFLAAMFKKEFRNEEIAHFDRFRELRNRSVYKAEKIIIEDAKECVEFAREMIKKIKSLAV